MSKALAFLLHELREAALPAGFFFVAFLIGAVTKALVLESYGLTPTGVGVAVVGALIVAKAVLIAEHLPFARGFAGRPLLLTVLWKAPIYWMLCLVFRLIEELVPLWSKYGSFAQALRQLADEAAWPVVLATQLWLVLALILYSALVEIDRQLGPGTIRRTLFGPASPRADAHPH